jgi:hypothetical protein
VTLYVAHARLDNIRPGQAEVRWFTPAAPDVPFGSSRLLGQVRRAADGRWHAVDADGSLLGAHYATRKAAVELLVRRRNDLTVDL